MLKQKFDAIKTRKNKQLEIKLAIFSRLRRSSSHVQANSDLLRRDGANKAIEVVAGVKSKVVLI